MEKSKKWKTLVQISKEANSFSGKKGDKFDGRGYFPNKNAKLANEVEEKAKAKVHGSAIKPKKIKSVYEDYEEEVLEKQIGSGMTSVPSKMKKHKVDSTKQSGAGIKYINPDNNYKQIFGESKMKKSQFKSMIKQMIGEILEGKGSAPGSKSAGGSAPATPGQLSKGGFNIVNYTSAGGEAGERAGSERGWQGGNTASRKAFRNTKASALTSIIAGQNLGKIDQWRTAALTDKSQIQSKSTYQGTKTPGGRGTKQKSVGGTLDNLASIRASDDAKRKSQGGRSSALGGAKMKVSATYINQKSSAKNTYNAALNAEISALQTLQNAYVKAGGKTDEKTYVALQNLIDDLGYKKEEYALRWDFATAAYNGDTSAMNSARSSIESKRDTIKKRAKAVGKDPSSGGSPTWERGGKYKEGDKVTHQDESTGKEAVTYQATIPKGSKDFEAMWSDIPPVDNVGKGYWVQVKDDGGKGKGK